MQKLKQIPKRVHHFLIGLVLTAVLGVLAFAVVNTYTAYTDMVVQQQQQYLLVTARAVSKTLSLYISGQLRDIEILTRSPGFLTEFENYYETGGDTALREHIVSYMLSQKRGVKRIYLLDKNSDVMYQYNDYPFLEVFDESLLHLKECAAAHTSGDENHIRPLQGGRDFLPAFLGGPLPLFRVGARAHTVGELLSDLDLLGGLREIQSLPVGVDGYEFHALNAGPGHTVDGVAAAAAHTDHLYLHAVDEITVKLKPHVNFLPAFIS